jgi:phosphoribosylformylglycinamidine cyclo-ligase
MIAVVPADRAEAAVSLLRDLGETVYTIGTVTEGDGVEYEGNLV